MNFHCYVALYRSFCTLLVLKMLTYAKYAPLFLTSQRTEITAHYEFSLLCGIVSFFLHLARVENAHIRKVCSAFPHVERYSLVANVIFLLNRRMLFYVILLRRSGLILRIGRGVASDYRGKWCEK